MFAGDTGNSARAAGRWVPAERLQAAGSATARAARSLAAPKSLREEHEKMPSTSAQLIYIVSFIFFLIRFTELIGALCERFNFHVRMLFLITVTRIWSGFRFSLRHPGRMLPPLCR